MFMNMGLNVINKTILLLKCANKGGVQEEGRRRDKPVRHMKPSLVTSVQAAVERLKLPIIQQQ